MKLSIVKPEKFYDIKTGRTTAFDKQEEGWASVFNGKINFIIPEGKWKAIVVYKDESSIVEEIENLDDVYTPLLLALAAQEALLDKGDSLSIQKATAYSGIINQYVQLIRIGVENERVKES